MTILIKNGTVVTADRTCQADVLIDGERIAAVGPGLTGDTVIDALHWVTARIAAEPQLAGGLAELEARFTGKRIIGVTSHRRENFGGGLENIAEAVRQIAARDDLGIVFPVHPNPNVRAVMAAQVPDARGEVRARVQRGGWG